MKFELLAAARAKVDQSIFLTGPARSGTSILTRLIYSLDRIEMFFEPTFLSCFVYFMEELSDRDVEVMLSVYLFRDQLLEAMAGRHINLNRHDESSIHHAKTAETIEARLGTSHRLRTLLPELDKYRIGFKLPDAVSRLERLRAVFPGMTFIATIRRPSAIIASWLERGWVSDAQLRNSVSDVVFRTAVGGFNIPAWVPEARIEEFIALPEAERCMLCIEEQYRELARRDDCLIVDYDNFVSHPVQIFGELAERLGEAFGPRTQTLLGSVREPVKNRDVAGDTRRLGLLDELYRACCERALGAGA